MYSKTIRKRGSARWRRDVTALPLVPAHQRRRPQHRRRRPRRRYRLGWAGVGLLRGGAGTALVGSHTEVADRIEEYAGLGVSEFILSGYPHLEEAYWFGEGVLPILCQRGHWQHPAPGSADNSVSTTPFAPASGPAHPAAVS